MRKLCPHCGLVNDDPKDNDCIGCGKSLFKHREIKVSFTCECGREVTNTFVDSGFSQPGIEDVVCECGVSNYVAMPNVYKENKYDPTTMDVTFYCDCGALLCAPFNRDSFEDDNFVDNITCPFCDETYQVKPPINSIPKKEK